MNILTTPFTLLAHELDVFFDFSWRDWSATLIPGSIFAIGGMRSAKLSPPSTALNYLFLVSWLFLYIYFFNLSNQITGVDEDRVDKPDRPIPSGKVTLRGAKVRWAIALSAFLVVGMIEPSLLPETICWVITTWVLCCTTIGNHWFGKNNVSMTLGAWALLGGSWKAVAPATLQSERWVYGISAWIGITAQLQDLRDIAGDKANGRKTMPVVFGDRESRWIIILVFMPIALYTLHWSGVLEIAPYTLTIAHLFLAYRTLYSTGSARYDHKTYMMYTYLFCFILLLTAGEGLELKATGGALWKFAGQTVKSVSAM